MTLKNIFRIKILLICICVNNCSNHRDILYHAVTPIEGQEQLYLNTKPPVVRWRVVLPEREPSETDDTKSEVCQTVITSEHFLDFYKVYPTANTSDRSNACSSEKSLSNIPTTAMTYPYNDSQIWIGKRVVDELVFPCFACSHETGKVVEFFISQVYEAQTRFVFTYNEEKKLIPVALAELSPPVCDLKERLNCTTNSDAVAILETVDTSRKICDKKTSATERRRVCAIVMNNLKYRDQHEVRYIPSYNRDPLCENRVIKLLNKDREVWAIPCIVVRSENMAQVVYYVADSTDSERYFVLKKEDPSYLDQVLVNSSWTF